MPGLVAVVDYGMGNLRSVANALELLGARVVVAARPEDFTGADRIVLPGVGAFKDCMGNLTARGFTGPLEACRLAGKPILGICLGMQAMARRGFEFGEHAGLGWFDADVVRLTPSDPGLRIPQIGWNEVSWKPGCPLFQGLREGSDFYFVHSFQMLCGEADLAASCDYGGPVTAAVMKGSVFATQFHPEKSQDHGLKVLENFLEWTP
jgi:glutamine amidotransferase